MNSKNGKFHDARRKQAGFTLIELMIVVAVIAVLGAIAFSSYTNNIVETRRKAAAACLMEQAQHMERWYTTRLTYDGTNPAPNCETELATFYTFDNPDATATATAFALAARPLGQQLAKDTECGVMGLNQTGTKSKTGTGTVDDCW